MTDVVIRQATNADISSVASFLSQSAMVHRHLDWRPILDWIDYEPFLLLYTNDCLHAALSCAPDPAGVAWIHIFAADQSSTCAEHWDALFAAARAHNALADCVICTVGLHDWFNQLLENSGFKLKQNIVVLAREGKTKLQDAREPRVLIRPMEPADLEVVAVLDSKAFDPIWVLSRDLLELAYRQSEHASVAELDGTIVGYELSTANHFSAHLARLAVDPTIARKHIGLELVRDMLDYFSRRGVQDITVNTQDNNVASLSLYKKLGFTPGDETFPVYIYQESGKSHTGHI